MKGATDMPGPTSDSYDPEFGTGADANDVRDAMQGVIDKIGTKLGPRLKSIVQVAHGEPGGSGVIGFDERDLRLIRFGLLRALESV